MAKITQITEDPETIEVDATIVLEPRTKHPELAVGKIVNFRGFGVDFKARITEIKE